MDKETKKYFQDLKDMWRKFQELRARTNSKNMHREEVHPDYLTIQNREFIIDELFRIIK